MFWFAFISIILFIIFLITILISMGRSTTDKNFRSLKEELEEKNRKLQEKKVSSKKEKKKPKPEPVAETLPPVVEEKSVEVVVEETPSVATEVELPVTLTPETPLSNVVEPEAAEAEAEPQTQEEPPEPFIEEVLEETPTVTQEDEKVVVEEEETPEVVLEELPSAVPEPEHPIEDVLEEAPPTVEEVVADDYDYPAFDNTRTMEEFGLSKEEADDFIVDLIQQIEDEMPSLITAVETGDSKQIEDISHMIKGSATNLGTGGVADVLIEFNTYMKTDNDPKVIAKHMRHLERALKELKEQFQ